MIYWERPGGGRVFHAGSINSGSTLGADPKWTGLLKNVWPISACRGLEYVHLLSSGRTTVPSLPSTSPPARRTVLLLMLCGRLRTLQPRGDLRRRNRADHSGLWNLPEKMGLVYSAFLVFYTLAMFPGGWFIDRFGARMALLLLGFASTVFVALTGCVGLVFYEATTLLLGLLVVRSLLGLVYAPLHPGSARMVADELPPEARPRALGWINFSACLGIAATQLVLGALIDRFDWQVALSDFKCAEPGRRHHLGRRNASNDERRTVKRPTSRLSRSISERSGVCFASEA